MNQVRWGFSFLLGSSALNSEEKLKLVTQATVLYLNNKERMEIAGDGYEGVLYTRREWKVIGGFSGQQFDAEIESAADEGKIRLRFLVSEQTLSGAADADAHLRASRN
jgi:hypothetical protein